MADFHSLRHSYLTNLTKSGAHVKVIQELARHSTIRLTMDRYSHVGLLDMSKALKGLSVPKDMPPEATETRKTGTDDLHRVQYVVNADVRCQPESSADKRLVTRGHERKKRKAGETNALCSAEGSYDVRKTGGGTRIRTGVDGFANRCLSHLAMPPPHGLGRKA